MESTLKLENKDKILFLGEGNFSFSKSYVEMQQATERAELGTQIYATCFQERLISFLCIFIGRYTK